MSYWQEAEQVIREIPPQMQEMGWELQLLILFGSTVSGHPKPESDLDLLAIVRNKEQVPMSPRSRVDGVQLPPSVHIFPGLEVDFWFSCLFDQILQKSPFIDGSRLFVPQALVFGVVELQNISDQVLNNWRSYAFDILDMYVTYFRPYYDSSDL